MNRHAVAGPLLALLLALPGTAALAAPTGVTLLDETVRRIEERFYDPAALDRFREAATAAAMTLPDNPDPDQLGGAIAAALSSLDASHTGRFTPDSIDYYELSDVFRYGIRDRLRALYPPRGEIRYAGIGLIVSDIDGRRFAAKVYDGSPAARAGIRVGDEILSADGAPYEEVASFRGKEGKTVAIELRRRADAAPVTVTVHVERLQPTDTLLTAIRDSAAVIERDGRRIGYIRLWTYHDNRVADVLAEALSTGRLADIDGLVLDMRSRWGGAPGDAGEMFLGGTPSMMVTDRRGRDSYATFRWHGPIVGIIDAGTRSGMEVLAYGLQQKGVRLVGANSAGALLAGQAFMLSDDSLLEIAVLDVRLDGVRLEGRGVAPDVPVAFDIRYAEGRDPQREAAIEEMSRQLAGG